MENVIQISKKVLERLIKMDYERKGGISEERLIFPNVFPTEKEDRIYSQEELLKYTRISEQELRFLFVEEFLRDETDNFYFSVETPTGKKYRFGKTFENIKIDASGRSASIDMCIFERTKEEKYNRLINIEFKNANASAKSISKDILKLIHEEENGTFILLLKNTYKGTKKNTLNSVFKKISDSFKFHKENQVEWNGSITGNQKPFIKLIILSLEEKKKKNGIPFLKYRKVYKSDYDAGVLNMENNWVTIPDLKVD